MKAIPKYVHNWKNIYIQTLEIHNLINSLTSNRFELRILYLQMKRRLLLNLKMSHHRICNEQKITIENIINVMKEDI